MTAARKQISTAKPRAGTLEREANRASARAGSVGGHAGQGLSRTEPGPQVRGIGVGIPLVDSLRSDAEQAFAADFRTVRLYPGALHPEGSRAVATGADILLRDAVPTTGGEGRSLLMHELAHVLQQTGRRGADGRLRAIRVHGRGVLHADGGEVKAALLLESNDPLEFLITQHSQNRTSAQITTKDPDLREVIDLLRSRFSSGYEIDNPEGTAGKELEKQVRSNRVAGLTKKVSRVSRPARSLLFDALKFAGHHKGAFWLLMIDWRLETVMKHEPFVRYLVGQDGITDLLLNILERDQKLNRFLYKQWGASLWNYLIDPKRVIQGLYGFKGYLKEVKQEAGDPHKIGRNDARYLCALNVEGVYDSHLKALRKYEKEAWKLSATRPQMKLLVSSSLIRQMENLLAGTAETELPPLFQGWAENILAIARRAHHFWLAALVDANTKFKLVQDEQPLSDEEREQFKLALPQDSPLVAELHDIFFFKEDDLFAMRDDGSFLCRRDYERWLKKLAKKVKGLNAKIAIELRTNLPREGDPDADRGFLALASLYHLLEILQDRLRVSASPPGFNKKKDQIDEKNFGSADTRILHRLHLARWLNFFSVLISNGVLEVFTADVLSGADRLKSTLILVNDWKLQTGSTYQQLRTDFVDYAPDIPALSLTGAMGSAKVDLPFTIDNLVSFYDIVYYEKLGKELAKLLQNTDPTLDKNPVPLIVKAYREANTAELPQRWGVKDEVFIKFSGDDRDFADILGEHPKTQNQLLKQTPSRGGAIAQKKYHGEVFAWILPPIAPLIVEMKKIDTLNENLGLTTPQAEAMSHEKWAQLLSMFVSDPAAEEAFQADLSMHLLTTGLEKEAAVNELIPIAIRHERQVMLGPLTEALLAYKEGDLKYYSKPNEALRWIQRFESFVTPVEDRPLQITALICHLADTISAAFSSHSLIGGDIYETRYDLISGYTPFLRTALHYTQDGEWAKMNHILRGFPDYNIDPEVIAYKAKHAVLQNLLDLFEHHAETMSERVSISSHDGKSLKSNLFSFEVATGEPFTIDGINWEIVKIYRKFTYLPPYGEKGKEVSKAKLLDGNRKLIKPSGRTVMTVKIGKTKHRITDDLTGDNLRYFEMLAHAVAMRAFVLSMENLKEFLEKYAEFLTNLLECIPGVGQAAMVARIIAQSLEFFASGQYQELLEVMRGDPAKVLLEIFNELTEELLSPDMIWKYLLFSGGGLKKLGARAAQAETQKTPKSVSKAKQLGKKGGKKSGFAALGRVIKAITSVPVKIHKSLEKVKARTAPTVISAQSFAATHPTVGYVVGLASVLVANSGYATYHAEKLMDTLASSTSLTAPGGAKDSFSAKLKDLMNSVNDFELPQELVPMKLISEALVDFLFDKFLRGCYGMLAEGILRGAGVDTLLSENIASSFSGSALDPNEKWRTEFRPDLQKAVEEGKKGFRESVNKALVKNFGLTPLPEPAPTQLGDQPNLVPEMQGQDAAPAPSPPAVSLGPGRPLSGTQRHNAERRFGHDFGHVRVHRGGTAERLTGHYQAAALTSGSHVVLGRGVTLDHSAGQQTFNHELGHVLQQTGSRPLGARVSSRPVLGRPGRGLNLNARAESEADNLAARAAGPGHRLGSPLPVTTQGAPGFNPKLLSVDTFASILATFSSAENFDKRFSKIEKSTIAPQGLGHFADAQKIWKAAADYLKTKSAYKGHTEADGIADLIEAYVTKGEPRKDIDKTVAPLAKMAEKTKTKNNKTEYILNFKRFANLLEGYVYYRTGVSLAISLNPGKTKFESLKVLSVDMGRCQSGKLQKELKDRTNKFVATSASLKALNEDDWRRLRARLRAQSPSPSAMDGKAFHLTKGFLEEYYLTRVFNRGATVQEWDQYAKTTLDGAHTSNSGLRVAKHGELKSGGVSPRNSHHMPQFLLVEYFENDATNKLFGDNGEYKLPGFNKSTKPTKFTAPGATINLGKLDPNSERGSGMPAVSLAAATHLSGKLHINASKSWDKDKELEGTSTQGDIIETKFRNYFSAAASQKGGPEASADYDKVAQWARANSRDKGPEAVLVGMQKTYDWVYNTIMKPRLRLALPDQEVSEYSEIAIKQPEAVEIKDDVKVLKDAYNPNHDLGKLGKVIDAIDGMQKSSEISPLIGAKA